MSDDKATDTETGISIRFVREFRLTPDHHCSAMCICGWSASRLGVDATEAVQRLFREHTETCPYAIKPLAYTPSPQSPGPSGSR